MRLLGFMLILVASFLTGCNQEASSPETSAPAGSVNEPNDPNTTSAMPNDFGNETEETEQPAP